MSEYCVYYRETGIGKNLSVGHFVPPADAKDAAKTLHVETVHLLLLLGVGCPDFTSVQDGDDYVCVIQRRLGWSGQLGLLPDTRSQPSKSCCGLSDRFVDLNI